MQTKHFDVLDSFRGICALSVVVFHMRLVNSATEYEFFRNSRLFVEFFFVLSGFVLSHSYFKKKNSSFTAFFINRTFRILPLHWAMLILYVFLELGKFIAYKLGFKFNVLPFTGTNSLQELLPNILLLQSWFPDFSYLSFNYPSWSISVEYYLYFGFFLLLMIQSILLRSAVAMIICFLMFVLPNFNIITFTGEVMRGAGCFIAGVLTYTLYILTYDFLNLRNNLLFGIMEFICLFATIYTVSSEIPYKHLVSTVVFSLTILIFSFECGILSCIFKKKTFLLLGKLSYSIYLVHAAVLFIVISICMVLQKLTNKSFTIDIDGERYLNLGSSLLNNFLIVIVLLLVVAIANVTYKFIEFPGQKLGKELLRRIIK